MRDVREQYGHTKVDIESHIPDWFETGPQYVVSYWPPPWSSPGTFLRMARGRSDVISSDGISPTPYFAYKVDTHTVSPLHKEEQSYDWISYKNPDWSSWRTYSYRFWVKTTLTGHPTLPAQMSKLGMNAAYEPNVPGHIVSRAISSALSNISDTNVDLGQTAGEIAQSADLMISKLAQIARAVNAAKRGNWAQAGYHLGVTNKRGKFKLPSRQGAAKSWLELQFGWMPILNDLFNYAEAIEKAYSSDNMVVKTEAVAVEDGIPKGWITYKVGGQIVVGCQVGMTYVVNNRNYLALDRLGLSNPVSLAWETLPLSFTIDWLLSVGSFLSALGGPHGLSFGTGYATWFSKGNYTITDRSEFSAESWPTWRVRNQSMQRFVLTSSPKPGVHINFNMNLGKLASAVALLNR